MAEDSKNGGFGLYVHWPFCEAKCPYCDFNSHVTRSIDQTVWANALAQEVRRVSELVPGRVLNSIFFGGGTPSLMAPETVRTVLEAARENWLWANDIEITLEANPRSVEMARFGGYADAGVNRVSLGVQALRADDLRRLGRLHDVDEARKAFEIARSVFGRVSFDLIYARQGQSLADWEAELTEALSLSVDHLSLYQLTIEKGTAFWDRAKAGKLRDLPSDDLAADMYDVTQELCAKAGLPAYEVSNHARPGAESRHNLIYWRYGDYAGVGPGAHGRLTVSGQKYATVAASAPGDWLARVKAGSGDTVFDAVSGGDQGGEYLMMGLRINEGVNRDRLYQMMGQHLDPDTIKGLMDLGLIWQTETALGVTPKGRLVLNSVIAELMPE
ncbi:radical SAM family heme chaperone HemW [Tropicibacter oceani]|uniref:Heme chaperone HemW n=1 Tax=Tropicibacter oceani TaxID=3058420 RepID=A0ABY8QNY4_9RHOB|nr:radical SAM family heme chaperone HemW [Tropicibacter oceani]WGW05768.1 radical SAM family heme chaperone HemW [Tropicibacter oceani]